jgi:transcriptional regulator with PAS, ATPase and Fis domain
VKPTVVHEGPTQVGSRIPDRAVIVATLAGHGGNQHLASQQLGINRRTLMRWMDQLKITRPRKG